MKPSETGQKNRGNLADSDAGWVALVTGSLLAFLLYITILLLCFW